MESKFSANAILHSNNTHLFKNRSTVLNKWEFDDGSTKDVVYSINNISFKYDNENIKKISQEEIDDYGIDKEWSVLCNLENNIYGTFKATDILISEK